MRASEGPQSGAGVNLFRSVSWNYLGYFCELIAGVLLLAYVVRRVPVEDYGLFLLAQSVAGFLYILDFGLSNVLVQLYVGTLTSKGVAEVARLASTLFWALMGTGAVGAMVLSLLALLVPQWMKLPAQRSHTVLALVVLASATVALALPAMAPEDLCRAFHRFDLINQLQAAMVVFRVVLTVAVLSAGKGIVGLAIVQALLSLVRLILLWTVAQSSIGGLSLRLFRFDAASLPLIEDGGVRAVVQEVLVVRQFVVVEQHLQLPAHKLDERDRRVAVQRVAQRPAESPAGVGHQLRHRPFVDGPAARRIAVGPVRGDEGHGAHG